MPTPVVLVSKSTFLLFKLVYPLRYRQARSCVCSNLDPPRVGDAADFQHSSDSGRTAWVCRRTAPEQGAPGCTSATSCSMCTASCPRDGLTSLRGRPVLRVALEFLVGDGRPQRPPGGPSLLATSGVTEGRPPANRSRKGWFTKLRRTEDVGHELALAQGVQGGDVQASCAGLQLLNTASLVDDEAEARGDGAAQALRPRLLSTVFEVIPERVRRGRPVAAGDQRRHDREPVREQLEEPRVHEVWRAEDVGDVRRPHAGRRRPRCPGSPRN